MLLIDLLDENDTNDDYQLNIASCFVATHHN